MTAEGCPDHAHRRSTRHDSARGGARQRGYDSKWDKARAAYLAAHPLCRYAERHGRTQAATVLDHIVPHRGDRSLFWDPSNWQPLSAQAHGAKIRREQGARCEEHGAGVAVVRFTTVCRDCGQAVEGGRGAASLGENVSGPPLAKDPCLYGSGDSAPGAGAR